MELIVVSVYDKAGLAYGRPAFVASVGQAIRSFQDEVNRDHPENILYHHPEDFELYDLGLFDDQTGLFTANGGPKQLAYGRMMKLSKKGNGHAPESVS